MVLHPIGCNLCGGEVDAGSGGVPNPALPHVVLLDLELPEILGEHVAAAVRGTAGNAVPVIVVSAAVDGRVRVDRAGADRFLAKPFDPGVPVAHVAACVRV